MEDANVVSDGITIEQLQEFLIYDDVFLEYFNEFLKLPAFPQPLEYHRLTDSFKIIDFGQDPVISGENPAPFIATKKEQERIMDWAQKYRLPLFLKTDVFRELKLCKLLLRPIEEIGNRPSRKQTLIHGYSKQSEYSSLVTPVPSGSASSKHMTTDSQLAEDYQSNLTSEDSSTLSDAKEDSDNDELYPNECIPYDQYIRPGSEALSLPGKVDLEKTVSSNMTVSRTVTNISKNQRETSNVSKNAQKGSRQKSFHKSCSDEEELFYRIQSAPLDFSFVDYDLVFTNKVLYHKHRIFKFDDEEGGSSEDDSLSDVYSEISGIQERENVSLNTLKEMYIGNIDGMREFQSFLQNTSGKPLIDFWLECEKIKDSGFLSDPNGNMKLIIKLLRSLRDKFRLKLNPASQNQLSVTISNLSSSSLSASASLSVLSTFIQAQYDALRRLRSYWLPRYLIHCDSCQQNITLMDVQALLMRPGGSRESVMSGIMHGMKLVKTLPMYFDGNQHGKTWNEIYSSPSQVLSTPWRIEEAKSSNKQRSDCTDNIIRRTLFRKRLKDALTIDKSAGCPFRSYLVNLNLLIQINNLEFFQEVHRFKQEATRNSERILRLSQAWEIVNRFLTSNSIQNIGVSDDQVKPLLSNIKKMKMKLDNAVFDQILEYSMDKLDQEWLRYLKDDMKKFLESSNTQVNPLTPPQSIEEIEVVIEDDTVVVRKKAVIDEIVERERTWNRLSVSEKRKRRAEALELKRQTEIQLKKDLQSVKRRLRLEEQERKLRMSNHLRMTKSTTKITTKIPSKLSTDEEYEEIQSIDDVSVVKEDIKTEELIPDVKKGFENSRLFDLFQKYKEDNKDNIDPEIVNAIDLLIDIREYTKTKGFDRETSKRKTKKSIEIYEKYLQDGAIEHVDFPKKTQDKIKNDKNRPKTPTFRDIESNIYKKLDDVFKEFWQKLVNELGVKSETLMNMSEGELEKCAKKQLEEFKSKKEGDRKADHTKEDKKKFMEALSKACNGPLTHHMLHFLKYIIDNPAPELKNGLEKDLFFYVEVLKLHEICRTTVEEDIAKKKIQTIDNVFLESSSPPALQINIPNELAQTMIARVKRVLSSKEVHINIFEEGQFHCLNNLLPYWAGFNKKKREASSIESLQIYAKYRQILENRLYLYNEVPIPKTERVLLPTIPKGNNITTLNYTMNDGAKWKSESIKDRFDQSRSSISNSLTLVTK